MGCNPGEPQDLDRWLRAGSLHRLKVAASELLKPQHQRLAAHRLSHDFGMRPKMIPNRGTNEIRAVGIEAFSNEKVDLAKIYEAKIDRNFLGFRRFCYC